MCGRRRVNASGSAEELSDLVADTFESVCYFVAEVLGSVGDFVAEIFHGINPLGHDFFHFIEDLADHFFGRVEGFEQRRDVDAQVEADLAADAERRADRAAQVEVRAALVVLLDAGLHGSVDADRVAADAGFDAAFHFCANIATARYAGAG
jgi:hypothetical protein